MRTAVALLAGLLLLTLTGGANAQEPGQVLLFGNQDNVLHIYDVTGQEVAAQTEVHSQVDGDPDGQHRDTNGQLCFFEEEGSTFFVGGEDTDQDEGEPTGWGIFRLDGERLGELRIRQVAKLIPTYQEHQVSNEEHYGCGFLSDGRLLLSDIGDQYPGFPANGQLHIWFPPFDYFDPADARYCKIATDIPTAGGIHVDEQDRVYITAQRDDVDPTGKRSGVYRISGEWPTSPGDCDRAETLTVEHFIPGGPQLQSASAIVPSPAGGFYVSSVFDGRINEYDAEGELVREILAPPPQETGQPPYSTGTPLGLAVDQRGTLYYADLGVVLGPPPGPAGGEGSIRRIRFDAAGDPLEPEVIDEGLDFPDGLGLLEAAAAPAPPSQEPAPAPPPSPSPGLPATGGWGPGGALMLLAAWLAAQTLVSPNRRRRSASNARTSGPTAAAFSSARRG